MGKRKKDQNQSPTGFSPELKRSQMDPAMQAALNNLSSQMGQLQDSVSNGLSGIKQELAVFKNDYITKMTEHEEQINHLNEGQLRLKITQVQHEIQLRETSVCFFNHGFQKDNVIGFRYFQAATKFVDKLLVEVFGLEEDLIQQNKPTSIYQIGQLGRMTVRYQTKAVVDQIFTKQTSERLAIHNKNNSKGKKLSVDRDLPPEIVEMKRFVSQIFGKCKNSSQIQSLKRKGVGGTSFLVNGQFFPYDEINGQNPILGRIVQDWATDTRMGEETKVKPQNYLPPRKKFRK